MKATKTTCTRCAMLERFGPGPYGPAEFASLGVVEPEPGRLSAALAADPEVSAAWEAVEQARVIADGARSLWVDAFAKHLTADLARGDRRSDRTVRKLQRAADDAAKTRDRAHGRLVAAQERHRQAQAWVRVELVAVERGDE